MSRPVRRRATNTGKHVKVELSTPLAATVGNGAFKSNKISKGAIFGNLRFKMAPGEDVRAWFGRVDGPSNGVRTREAILAAERAVAAAEQAAAAAEQAAAAADQARLSASGLNSDYKVAFPKEAMFQIDHNGAGTYTARHYPYEYVRTGYTPGSGATSQVYEKDDGTSIIKHLLPNGAYNASPFFFMLVYDEWTNNGYSKYEFDNSGNFKTYHQAVFKFNLILALTSLGQDYPLPTSVNGNDYIVTGATYRKITTNSSIINTPNVAWHRYIAGSHSSTLAAGITNEALLGLTEIDDDMDSAVYYLGRYKFKRNDGTQAYFPALVGTFYMVPDGGTNDTNTKWDFESTSGGLPHQGSEAFAGTLVNYRHTTTGTFSSSDYSVQNRVIIMYYHTANDRYIGCYIVKINGVKYRIRKS